MSDQLTEELREQLQRHGATLRSHDLVRASRRRAVSIRRRRRVGLVGVLATLLAIPTTAVLLSDRPSTSLPPVVATPSPGPSTPAGPRSLDLRTLPSGPPPTVDYVHQMVWHRADGTEVTMASAVSSTSPDIAVRYRGGLFTLVPVDGELGFALDGGRAQKAPVRSQANGFGVHPGPDGSVIIEADRGVVVLDRAGRWRQYPRFDGSHYEGPRGAADSVWAVRVGSSGQREVVRRSSWTADAEERVFPQWLRVIEANPVSNLVIVLTTDGCTEVVDGTTGDVVFGGCEYAVQQVSSDGRWAVAYGPRGTAVIDLRMRQVQTEFVAPNRDVPGFAYAFSDDGTLNMLVDQPGNDDISGVVSCALDGTCWRSADWSKDTHLFVQPNRE